MTRTALVAIGGNSLIDEKVAPDIPHQWDAVRETCRHLGDMVASGWQLIITHGNGPQVGFNLRRSELAAHEIYPLPLDLIVAHTQGSIGYMLQQAISNELSSRGLSRPVVTVVTQVQVAADDPAFSAPTKPIGRFMTESEARKFEAEGWHVAEDAGRGWRRVVASPEPQSIIEKEAIGRLVKSDCIVIAAGGGGIPVVVNKRGELREIKGAYAVIDKDRASSLLACQLGVELLLISTGVEKVALNFNQPGQQNLDRITAAQAAQYLAGGHFAAGSMKPKIEAVLNFVNASGRPAVITNPQNISRALSHDSGTWIEPASQ